MSPRPKKASRSAKSPVSATPPKPEGQLALDIYQTQSELVIIAPIAGVRLQDIKVSVTEDVLTIQGTRDFEFSIPDEDWFTQECFWGSFSRSVVLPSSVDPNKISASFKDCVLKITIPKVAGNKAKVVRVKSPDAH